MTVYPLVSIIIPTYNQQDSICRTIISASSQDYSNLEIIIADDSSIDNTGIIASKISEQDPRVKYFCNRQNIGRINNYRKALYEYASGDYAINLDGDDLFIDNTFISTAISRIQLLHNDLPVMVVACKKMVTKKGEIEIRHNIKEPFKIISGLDFVFGIFTKYQFSHLTTLYDRKEAIKNNFYSLPIQSTDIDSILRIALNGNVIVTDDLVGQWNETDSNISRKYDINQSLNNLQWIDSVLKELEVKIDWRKRFLWKLKCRIKFSYPILLAIYYFPQQLIEIKDRMLFFKMIIPSVIFLLKKMGEKTIKNFLVRLDSPLFVFRKRWL